MKYDKVYYCSGYAVAKDYKYMSVIWESNTAYGDLYASDNLQQLKSFVYHQIKQLYDTARGNIYYSSDKHFDDPIYMVWNEGSTTHSQNL